MKKLKNAQQRLENMGVDISIKVRIFESEKKWHPIEVSDQDNSLSSIFHSNDTIIYTSVKWNRDSLLTEKEIKFFQLKNEFETLDLGEVIPAKEFEEALNKIYKNLFWKLPEALANDLDDIEIKYSNIVKREEFKLHKIRDYFQLENSLSLLIGIIRTASSNNQNIQIEAWYY